MIKTKYTYRLLAKVVIEAQTPLAVGSGEYDVVTDAPVVTDVNGMPYIPGTSLAGILRNAFSKNDSVNQLFGYQTKDNGSGSEIIFTNAHLVGYDHKVLDGLYLETELFDSLCKDSNKYYQRFRELPIRQHTKIDCKGVTEKHGKYDEQIVYKGSRFCFELEVVADNNSLEKFNEVLSHIYSETFRVGSGSRSGFGQMKVIDCKTTTLNLQDQSDLERYLSKSSNLSDNTFWNQCPNNTPIESSTRDKWVEYKLEITPEDFILFGSGMGSDDADMTPVLESYIDWSKANPTFIDKNILIPATSFKGAISHRVAFYYNKFKEIYADIIDNHSEYVGNKNQAVLELFGSEGEMTKRNDCLDKQRGNILFSDIIEKPKQSLQTKILNHVLIDDFTGGTIEGGLFTEEVIYGNNQQFVMTLLVDKQALVCEHIQKALELSLQDVCSGMLPLGGGVNRGNGCFIGKLLKDGEIIYE